MSDFKVFETTATIDLPPWNSSLWTSLRATVTVRYDEADNYICSIGPGGLGGKVMVEVEGAEVGKWVSLPAEEVARQVGCSVMKLGDLFDDAVESEVYQRVIRNVDHDFLTKNL